MEKSVEEKYKFNRIESCFLYILSYCMIYISGTAKQQFGGTFMAQLLIFSFTFILFVQTYKKIEVRVARVTIVLLMGAFALSFNSGEFFLNFIYKIMMFLFFFGTCIFFEKKHIFFEEILFQTFIFLSILSFIGFILVNFVKLSSLQSTAIGIYKNFYGIYYYSTALWVDVGVFHFYRMASIYWEPGVYAMYLCIAFCYVAFLREHKRTNGIYIVFIVINILLTVSTTGYMILALLLVALWFNKARVVPTERRAAGIVILGAAFLIALSVLIVKKNSTNVDVMSDGKIYNSYDMRLLDLTVGIRLFLRHPIAGVGYYNMEEFSELLGYDRGDSNGIISWMFQMGILGVIFLVIPFIKFYFKCLKTCFRKKNLINYLVYIIVFILVNMSEPLLTLPIMVYLLAREYSKAYIANTELRNSLK